MTEATVFVLSVAVQTPAHSGLGDVLSYRHTEPVAAGTLVRVPLGAREVLGVVWDAAPAHGIAMQELRAVARVITQLPALDKHWRRLVAFAARYYQRSMGELALASLPAPLRDLTLEQLTRRLQRHSTAKGKPPPQPKLSESSELPELLKLPASALPPVLSAEQSRVLERIRAATEPADSTDHADHPPSPEPTDRPNSPQGGVFLLYGSTGSGKTEVYLQCAARVLARHASAQVLVLVPEINLTPQLHQRFAARFAPLYGDSAVVSLHSSMTPSQRLSSWLAAHSGQARIVLGTRMAVFASLPHLALIVVDEEHDASYKQQEGARYSARDLAVWRGREHHAPVILGSATPSLESWHASDPAVQRYQRLHMPSRIGAGPLAHLCVVDMRQQPRGSVFSPPLLAAITQRVTQGEQCLVLLNRRGFAPVLHCHACDWKSDCPQCSAHQVFHKIDRTLRCHHCSATRRVPRACPVCGNLDIAPIGRGTEQLEEELAQLLRNCMTPAGRAARVMRIDADSTRSKGALEEQLALVHSAQVDVLVGTQMVAKGHDFRRITLVAAVQPDGALFCSDFRAPERLFSLLMQAAGRAGRDAQYLTAQGSRPEMWVQTYHPDHALYAALRQQDYPHFAAQQLAERQASAMPPFAYQALVRADARSQEAAQAFLQEAAQLARTRTVPGLEHLFIYPPIPLTVQRVAAVERAQMLIESNSRPALQHFLSAWQGLLHELRRQHKTLVRWLIDVDPQGI